MSAHKTTKFLLLSREGQAADAITAELRSEPGFEVIFETHSDRALDRMSQKDISCLVLNLEAFSLRQIHLIQQIRDLGYKFQIVVFADEINDKAAETVERMHDVVIIARKYIDMSRDLIGLTNRILAGERSVKRGAVRRATRQQGLVENVRTGHKFTCMAYNMSENGAYIEYGAGSAMLNDVVYLVVQLSQVKKSHKIKSQIVWLTNAASGMRAAGLRFLKG